MTTVCDVKGSTGHCQCEVMAGAKDTKTGHCPRLDGRLLDVFNESVTGVRLNVHTAALNASHSHIPSLDIPRCEEGGGGRLMSDHCVLH